MKKHVNNVIYYSFVPLCIHVLVCILTPVYQSCCPSKFAETCYQATLSKSILKKISTRAPFVIIEDRLIKTRAESKRAQFNYFLIENSNHKKSDQHLITTKYTGYVLKNTQIINWSYVLCKGFAYGAENPALIFILIYRSLNSYKFLRIYLVRPSKVDVLKVEMK